MIGVLIFFIIVAGIIFYNLKSGKKWSEVKPPEQPPKPEPWKGGRLPYAGGIDGISQDTGLNVIIFDDRIEIEFLYLFDRSNTETGGRELRKLTIKRSDIESIAIVSGSKFIVHNYETNQRDAVLAAGVPRYYTPTYEEDIRLVNEQREKLSSKYFIMINYLDAVYISENGERYSPSGHIDFATRGCSIAEDFINIFAEDSIRKVNQL